MGAAADPATPLWPHQRAAMAAAVDHLIDGGRATAVAACGTGKTRTGAECLRPLGARRVLVTVPTVDLLAQTVHAYREVYGDAALGPIVAVCSDQNVTRRHEIDLRAEHADVTTSPDELNQLTSGHRCTVFTTYASLTVIAEAHRGHGAAPWDLAVVDEAHRTAGEQGRPWSAIHDDRQIPAHAGYI